MITGTMTSKLDGTARIWTLTVPEAPQPGQLIEWSEPACGSVPAREGVRGWITDDESARPGTVIVTVLTEGTRWVVVNVEDQADPAPCLRRNAHEPHDTPRGRCPGTAPEYPSEAVERVADVTEAPAAVELFSAEWPRPQLAAADFAAIYTAAAGHIEARGYFAYEVQGYGEEPGLSITGALKLAALEHVTAADPAASHGAQLISARDLTEELETRLSAVLYVYGQAWHRTGINDLTDVHVGWSLGHFESAASGRHTGWDVPAEEYALTLLRKAAAIFTMIDDDSAPVTEAPARF